MIQGTLLIVSHLEVNTLLHLQQKLRMRTIKCIQAMRPLQKFGQVSVNYSSKISLRCFFECKIIFILFTEPNPAEGIVRTSVTPNSFTVTWNEPSSGHYERYIVSLQEVANSEQTVEAQSDRSQTFDELVAGTAYTVKIVTQANTQQSDPATATFYTSQ